MASSKNDEKSAGARRATTGGVDSKTGEGSGQQATAAAGGTPASSGFTTSPDMDAAGAELNALLESLGATGPDRAATAQEQEEQRQVLHHYLSQALNQDLKRGGTPLLSVSSANPGVDSSDAELDALLESVGVTGPDTAATAQEQEEQRQTLHQYLGQTLNPSQDENQQDQHRRDLNRDQRQGQDHDGDAQDEEKADDEKGADDENLLDRHNRTVAQILTRFRNIIKAATEPLPREGAVLEHAALNRFTMQTEMAALITEIQNLLALNREIKALWIRGPLRKPGENDGLDAEIDRKSVAVADMYQKVMDMFEEKKKAEARAGAGASSWAPGGEGKGNEVKGEEGVKRVSQ
ncbi:hypothetical protein DL770_011910 [Monosporascus sp. CRB-9-2]|nr:hypothetical protein DL770_011910 [Monosporascus sp. CRB-9-2]